MAKNEPTSNDHDRFQVARARGEARAKDATANDVKVSNDALIVDLRGGRTVSVPLTWYPRLADGRPAERRNWQFIGTGTGIHWPDLAKKCCVGFTAENA